MDYLLLTYQTDAEVAGISDEERHLLLDACHDNTLALRERGTLLMAATLPPHSATATVQLHNDTISLKNDDTVLTGVYLIHANDMNDAIRTAATMPQARLGIIEIRAIGRVEGKG